MAVLPFTNARTGRRLPRAVALVAACLAASLLAVPASAREATASGSGPAVPKLAWRSCGADAPGFDCATVKVPLDYDRPRGAKITLALTRLPATNPGARIGSIFFNPGGPGGSGVDFVQGLGRELYSPQVRARFDLVGFDPRGVARSTPLQCFDTTDEALAALAAVPVPGDPPGGARLDPGRPGLGQGLRRARRADPRPHVDRQRRPRHGPAPPGGRRPQDDLRRLLLRVRTSAPPTPTCSRARSGRW